MIYDLSRAERQHRAVTKMQLRLACLRMFGGSACSPSDVALIQANFAHEREMGMVAA